LIVAGFDEAGYGPRLGPLTVAWTAFEVDGEPRRGEEPDLWRRLRAVVRREGKGDAHKLWVADSKRIKPRKDGVRQLELGALAFLASAAALPKSLPELLVAFGQQPTLYDPVSWYGSLAAQKVPAYSWSGEVRTRAGRIEASGGRNGVSYLGAGVRVVPAALLNARIAATGSKGAVLGEVFCELLAELRARREGPLLVTVDRHGGRIQYAPLLGRAFPNCPIEIDAEGGEVSAYRVKTPPGPVAIRFRSEAELGSLPVALASMHSKYLRELFMEHFNRWFQDRVPGLKRTAGYATDAKRFLADVETELPRLGVALDTLVRAR